MTKDMLAPLLPLFPPELRSRVQRIPRAELEELRLRAGQPLGIVCRGQERLLSDSVVTQQQIEQLIGAASGHSSFAALGEGYLTLPGGHRLGFCGQAVVKDGVLTHFRAMTAANLRLARQIPGVAEPILTALGGRAASVLLIGPPGSGKTTALRDLIRLYADRCGQRVGVADERGELAAVRDGLPQYDVGQHTDVLTGAPRGQGLELLLRVMNPTVLAMDEIVSDAEIQALRRAGHCGVRLLATAHADSLADCNERDQLAHLRSLFPWVAEVRREGIRMERWVCGS